MIYVEQEANIMKATYDEIIDILNSDSETVGNLKYKNAIYKFEMLISKGLIQKRGNCLQPLANKKNYYYATALFDDIKDYE